MFVIHAIYFLTIYTKFFTIQIFDGFFNFITLCNTTGINRMLCSIVCWWFYINRMNESYQSNETKIIESTKLMNIVEHQKIKRWVEIWYICYIWIFYLKRDYIYRLEIIILMECMMIEIWFQLLTHILFLFSQEYMYAFFEHIFIFQYSSFTHFSWIFLKT